MSNKKNIIWIMADQLRASALSCNGDNNVRTPNINRLSAMGMNFKNAVSGYPLCCPFRGSLLTSKYPHQCVEGHEYPMPDYLETIASPFNQAGYLTGYFGKWHVDGYKEEQGRSALHTVPYYRRGGFKMWLGYDNNNDPWDSWVHGHDMNQNEIKHQALKGYETNALTDLALNFIDQVSQAEKPFFTVLSVQPPHDPYVAPSSTMAHYNPEEIKIKSNVPRGSWVEKKARQDLAGYYAQIETLDANIGRIIELLIEKGVYQDTHILFFSDHGDMHGSHGIFKKTTFFEEAIRIPMIISGGSVYDGCINGETEALINHVDNCANKFRFMWY